MAARRHRYRIWIGVLALLAAGGAWLLHGQWTGRTLRQSTMMLLQGERVPCVCRPALKPITGPLPVNNLITAPGDSGEKKPATAPAEPLIIPSTQPAAVTLDHEQARGELADGLAAKRQNDLVAARAHLNRALQGPLPPEDIQKVRTELAELSERTIFSPKVFDKDPLAASYIVSAGDNLARIAKQYKTTDDCLALLNNLSNKNNIRQGQRIKVIQGPFHAVIDKKDHLLHLYLQDVYVRTMRVALGANGSTPLGRWKVLNHQTNPQWVDPRTGRTWPADDPENPIGEYWIGLEGLEGPAAGRMGFGIHGTIEPQTIGQDVSMGCVRLADADIELLFKMLVPDESYVTIQD